MIKPLIYNSDIKAIQKKAERTSISIDESSLLRQAALSESEIQQACKRIFCQKFGSSAKFIQLDNGGKMSVIARARKKREGTEVGAPDILLIGKNRRSTFVEFKKIECESKVDPSLKQKLIHKFLEDCKFSIFVTNNTIFFEKVICEEFEKGGEIFCLNYQAVS